MIAPDFSLSDQHNQPHSLSDDRGKWVVLYFYPKDDTPGCTKEACSFRDYFTRLQEKGAAVLGISKDSVASHQKFAEKYHLNFPILSDPETGVIKAYTAWGPKRFMGKEFTGTLRKTFIINPAGEIVKEYPQVTPDKHAEEILHDLETLMATA
ncbi:thioredoxin-dependent thiol peroxidase [Patescibacteria group bacterium]|nr:thioredoxin-dependent thiol peroxidase [Patescibacteria group bacterium]